MIWKLFDFFFLLIIITALSGYGSNFDIIGKGKRTRCFYLETDSLAIKYECDDRSVVSAKVYRTDLPYTDKSFMLLDTVFASPVKSFILPVKKEQLNSHPIEISLKVTDTYWREIFYVDIKPGDIDIKKKIDSRYLGH